jgi:cytochrome c
MGAFAWPGSVRLWLSLALCALLGWLMTGCGAAQPPTPGDPLQVTWGATIYRLECARCHNPGRSGPVLTEARLVRYPNAEELFVYIRQNMPLDKPGALPEQDYWDVTAYLLAMNGLLAVPEQAVLNADSAHQVDFTPP